MNTVKNTFNRQKVTKCSNLEIKTTLDMSVNPSISSHSNVGDIYSC